LKNAKVDHRPAVGIIVRVENKGLQLGFRVTFGRRKPPDNRFQNLRDAGSFLGRDEKGLVGVEAQIFVDLFLYPVDIGGRQIDFVDDRNDLEVVLHGQVEIGQGLGFDPLAGVDQEQGAFAGCQRTRHLIAEVHVAGCIDEIEMIVPAVGGAVGEADGLAFDGDPAFALDIHRIEKLVVKVPVRNDVGGLDQAIAEG
jgi:hypothetical protein